MGVYHDTLTFASAPAALKVKVSSLFIDRFTDLKTEKTVVFALIRLRNTTVFFFRKVFFLRLSINDSSLPL